MKRTRRCTELARKTFAARPEPAPVSSRRVHFRLDDQLVAQLLASYQAGSTGRQLAERYGLARSTIIELLRKHSVAVRHPRVTPEQAVEMLRLCQSGMQQVEIAKRFGRDPGTVWHVLKRAGAFAPPSSGAI